MRTAHRDKMIDKKNSIAKCDFKAFEYTVFAFTDGSCKIYLLNVKCHVQPSPYYQLMELIKAQIFLFQND